VAENTAIGTALARRETGQLKVLHKFQANEFAASFIRPKFMHYLFSD
jgi:hypothetical protein